MEEGKKKKTRRVNRCTTCKSLVAGHVGPCGRRCKNRPLITLDERDAEPTEDVEEVETEVEDDEDDEVVVNAEQMVENSVESGTGKSNPRVMGSNPTSTPRPGAAAVLPSWRILPETEVTRDILATLLSKFTKMEDKIEEIEKRTLNTIPVFSVATVGNVPTVSAPPAVVTLATGTNVSYVAQEVRMASAQPQVAPSQPQVPPPVLHVPPPVPQVPQVGPQVPPQVRRMDYLRPVSDTIDLGFLRPHDVLPDKLLREALRGEFILIDDLLGFETLHEELPSYESYFEKGVMMFRPKQKRRHVVDCISWLEGWATYEEILATYHGLEVYKLLCAYKRKVIEWTKKYKWPHIYSWDKDVRRKMGGWSMDFCSYNSGDFAHHFDKTTYLHQSYKCSFCSSGDHCTDDCPFGGAPGNEYAGGRQERLVQYGGAGNRDYMAPRVCSNFNYKKCYNRSCNRIHACKQCGGHLPFQDCKKYGRCARSPSWN